MRYSFFVLCLAGLAACDASPLATSADASSDTSEQTGPQTITYRVETVPAIEVDGVAYASGVVQVDLDYSGPVRTPWEIDVPYFEGLKNVALGIPNVDATVSILIDGDVVAENHFSPGEIGARPNTIVGAVAGLPVYNVEFITSVKPGNTPLGILKEGVRVNSFSSHHRDDMSSDSHTIQAAVYVTPGETLTFTKGASEGILGVSVLSSVGSARHIMSLHTWEAYELDFSFTYDGR